MADKDPLDKPVSVSGKLTKTGLQASAHSRAVSAGDRLLGNLVDLLNLPIESRNRIKRAKVDAEVQLINAATEALIEAASQNPAGANVVIKQVLSREERRAENKLSVVEEALQQLTQNPPTDEEANSGPDRLADEFIDRFERYAEDASTEELRQKWANVLASEVRVPGTFGRKVMRILDEIDNETAQKFSDFCRHRIGGVVPLALHQPKYNDAMAFEDNGLIATMAAGPVRNWQECTDDSGKLLMLLGLDDHSVAVEKGAFIENVKNLKNSNLLRQPFGSEKYQTGVVVLSDTGCALLNLFENPSQKNVVTFAKMFQELGVEAVAFERTTGDILEPIGRNKSDPATSADQPMKAQVVQDEPKNLKIEPAREAPKEVK
ncbi:MULTISPECIES: DUF2806 domain-containing protein [unclassified Roseibium]|uniref:DUF2806 domain-containing protein n=1 Tax=unclassified Roseibium TaxID=2629323 RepID=UPI00273D50D7|nr:MULTISPECIES: DUF2806 domain-containing protein [unclassified Roseibium]